jgi:hypothetical protein
MISAIAAGSRTEGNARGALLLRGSRVGASRRENASCCHHPRRRVIQYSETPMIGTIGRCVLDTPHARGMTGEWSFAFSSVIASGAKQSISPREERMDCFRLRPLGFGGQVLLAMTRISLCNYSNNRR